MFKSIRNAVCAAALSVLTMELGAKYIFENVLDYAQGLSSGRSLSANTGIFPSHNAAILALLLSCISLIFAIIGIKASFDLLKMQKGIKQIAWILIIVVCSITTLESIAIIMFCVSRLFL